MVVPGVLSRSPPVAPRVARDSFCSFWASCWSSFSTSLSFSFKFCKQQHTSCYSRFFLFVSLLSGASAQTFSHFPEIRLPIILFFSSFLSSFFFTQIFCVFFYFFSWSLDSKHLIFSNGFLEYFCLFFRHFRWFRLFLAYGVSVLVVTTLIFKLPPSVRHLFSPHCECWVLTWARCNFG